MLALISTRSLSPLVWAIVAFASFNAAILILLWRQRRTSARLKCALTQLHLVLDNMNEGIVLLNRDRTIALINTTATRLISVPGRRDSYDAVEAQYDALTPDGIPLARAEWPTARALRGDFVRDFPVLLRRKDDGSTGSRFVTTAPAPGATGQIIISYRDDTERRRVEEARSRLADIVNSSADSILSTDIHGAITTWNHGAEKVYGYTAAEMIGQSIKRLLPADRAHEEDDILAKVLHKQPVERFNTTRCTSQGRTIHVSITVSPICDDTGEIIGVSRIARDMTETRNLERQLHHAQKMEAVGQLTGGIAHDFNNLLGVVIGSLDLLETLIPGNKPALKRTRIAQKAALRGADVARRLLTFASDESLSAVPTSLHACIHNTLEIAGRAIGAEIAIVTDIDAVLPAVCIDPAGFESALLNLIVNARDAMPSGGALDIGTKIVFLEEADLRIEADIMKPGPYACVSVSDNGQGMSRETLQRAFEPFYTTKARDKGTGLGLAMVYGFARQSRGSVRIYSESGQGTTISLYLPFAEVSTAPVAPSTIRDPSHKPSATLLLVDDELDLLDIASAYLGKLGYTVLRASDGISALDMIARHPDLDVLVTDIIMPGGINGLELARRARQRMPQLKVLYTSGYPADALTHKTLGTLDGALLHKPYRLAELSVALRNALRETPVSSR